MFPRPAPSCRRDAIALVIVLSCLALITVLIVAFLSSVTTELSSSTGFANSNDARQKSQLAVNLVMAQIQDATGTDPNKAPTAADPPIAWASQPGMIRTYDATGNPAKQYKLYSASTMVMSDFKPVATDGTAADVDANWSSMPAAFVDLNSPVTDLSGKPNYPIVDPGALIPNPAAPITYPDNVGVEGFKIASNTPAAGGTSPNRAPMPVRWMYVLKDGKLRTTGTDGKTIADASDTNPIVSRVAFWTDDDTCKININTAAGDIWDVTKDPTYTGPAPFVPGSFTGMSLGSNFTDSKLRLYQPLQHEYQRYPGHPATTYLSAVFPDLTRANIFDLSPKISPDSSNTSVPYSNGGTVQTADFTSRLPFAKSSHLYASVDEFRFRTKTETATVPRTSNNPAVTSQLTPDRIKKAEFFLTAHSRAPEINLFNKPRVTIWPEDSNPAYRTTFDNNLALCSTVGGRPFYFVRDSTYGNTSPTVDVTLSNGPWSNMAIYNYLHDLTGTNIPGFGGNFAAKYDIGTSYDRDQILTEIFDYIRCTNLIDVSYNSSEPQKSHPYAGKPNGTYTQDRSVAPGNGFVVPAYISSNDTMGFGRAFTLYTPILEFYAMNSEISASDMAAYDKDGDKKIDLRDGKTGGVYNNTLAKIKTKSIQAVLLMDNFSVSHGVVRFTPNLDYVVTGLDGNLDDSVDGFKLNGTSLGFNHSATATFQAICGNNEYAWGGITSAANLFMYWNGSAKQVMTVDQYPLKGVAIGVDSEYRQPLNFKGGKLKVEVYARSRTGVRGDLIQTIHLSFPDTQIPTPVVRGCVTYGGSTGGLTLKSCPTTIAVASNYFTYHAISRSDGTKDEGDGSTEMVNPGWQSNFEGSNTSAQYLWDATRSLTPSHGDMRLVAARHDVDQSVFIPAPGCTYQGAYLGGGYFDPVETAYTFSAPYGTVANGKVSSRWIEPHSGGMINSLPRTANGGGKWGSSGWLIPQNLLLAAGSASLKSGVASTYPNNYDMHFGNPDYQMGPAVQDNINGAFLVNNSLQTLKDSNGNPCLGDWDNGMAGVIDGPYINKPDEGEMGVQAYSSYSSNNPYMVTATLFSPNRQVPSPVIFGSLSTGVKAGKPWQTLLFNPNPEGKAYHPGFGISAGTAATPPLGPLAKPPFAVPPDHLLLDLFTMPIVEPYAISEPFSTAGKINMNFQIVPFTYLERSTGMQAVLASARVGAIPTNEALNYKPSYTGFSGPGNGTPYRYSVDLEETLVGFRSRFSNNEIFRSASQICEMPLIPAGQGIRGLRAGSEVSDLNSIYANFWDKMLLTGDNMREQPYANIYGRLTTKSNSYTVHVWTQTLRKVPGTPSNQWIEARDQVTGEYRGSYEIERFLDPGLTSYDPTLPLTAYKFRTVNSKQFVP